MPMTPDTQTDLPPLEDCVTTGEAAEIAGVSTQTIHRMIGDGRLRKARMKGAWRMLLRTDVEAMAHPPAPKE